MTEDEFEHGFDGGASPAGAEDLDARQEVDEQEDMPDVEDRVQPISGNKVPKRRAVLIGAGVVLAIALVCMGAWYTSARRADARMPALAKQAKSDSGTTSFGDGENAAVDADEYVEKGAEAGADADVVSSGNDEGKPAARAAKGSGSSASQPGKASPSKGSSGAASKPGPKHTHDWVPKTTTVHHDAQYDYVYHDAVTKSVVICNHCNAQFNGVDAWATHIDAYIDEYLATNPPFEEGTHTVLVPNASYRTESVVVKPGWEEQVLVSEAWDETVTVGYVCSGCGAAK